MSRKPSQRSPRHRPASDRTSASGRGGTAGPGRSIKVWLMVGLGVLGGAIGGILWMKQGATGATVPNIAVAGLDSKAAALIDTHLQAVRANPRSGRAWGHLGAVLKMYDYRTEARACLEEAERLEPKEPRWPYLLAPLLAKSSPDAALARLRRTVDLCGAEPEMPRLRLAQMLGEAGKLEEAIVLLESQLQAQPGSGPARMSLARIRQAQRQWDQAAALAAGCTTNPYTAKAAWTLLSALHQRTGDTNAAQNASRRASRLAPDAAWPDPFEDEFLVWRGDARSLSEQAQNYLTAGQLDLASATLERLTREHPQFAQAWLLIGRLKVLQKQPVEAEEFLRRYVREDPDSVNGHFQLGMSLLGQQRYAEAVAVFQQAIALKQDLGPAYFNLAFCLVKSGKRQEAVAPFREAIRLNPDAIDSYILLADLCLQLGRKDDAAQLAAQAALVNSKDARLAELQRRIAAAP